MIFNKYPYIDFSNLNMDWILSELKRYSRLIDDIDGWKDAHEKEYEELKKLVDDVYNGILTPALQHSIVTWLNNHAEDIISEWVKMVFFGLTDTGYFVAYIPSGWEDITFNTTEYDITVPLMPDYGHLVLSY